MRWRKGIDRRWNALGRHGRSNPQAAGPNATALRSIGVRITMASSTRRKIATNPAQNALFKSRQPSVTRSPGGGIVRASRVLRRLHPSGRPGPSG
jgi:hypothetical protein